MVVCFLSSVTELVQISRIIAENDPQCSRRSTDDIMRINFRLRFWSRGLRVVVLHFCTKFCANIFIQYEDISFYEIQ